MKNESLRREFRKWVPDSKTPFLDFCLALLAILSGYEYRVHKSSEGSMYFLVFMFSLIAWLVLRGVLRRDKFIIFIVMILILVVILFGLFFLIFGIK